MIYNTDFLYFKGVFLSLISAIEVLKCGKVDLDLKVKLGCYEKPEDAYHQTCSYLLRTVLV